MKKLWSKNCEKDFFLKSMEFATPEQLFYVTKDQKMCAYWPKKYGDAKTTLQSRNSLIGNYTEKWGVELFKEIAEKLDAFSVQGVVCEEIGLTRQSAADVAICESKNIVQKPENILMIFEIKMSIAWNWELTKKGKDYNLVCLGDYNTHQGNPSLLRSDSMLKAIGKSINIRVSNFAASKIPIVIIGNTPVTNSYYDKVDHLKQSGIIQGFWSVNPEPLDNGRESLASTKLGGFIRINTYDELVKRTLELGADDREFFSSMQSKQRLGEIIRIADQEETEEAKAQKFLELIREAKINGRSC
ncbi:MAG: hypothetical protein COV00_03450 [Candidatus Tagabacteria bacterium CG10_big_fil_rev_8_21_14_0_10_40_13]|uniref:Uncharacterized protein n=1 Tax=Candidatus Tagabacteria bacterium CG10_big_fil_rev_8_21_14_0_10_40_13 TaxID=1975022 RepID=A0A2M8L839_9BACT|nr:MAG: hypothetical protein COV00_03450 [Candidatus Tagabacteria bacterium CG10_big_fil_rev_8_21_14_0_10_40_13]